jgi:prephenate dehydratase
MGHSSHIIAIQGIAGSFHDEAAHDYFRGGIEVLPCETFRDLFRSVAQNRAGYAVMAIENTVAGTILPNYALLRNSSLRIIGEVYLAIRQNLLALPGQQLADIEEVHSHPMALQQCADFFEEHPKIRLIESADTAASAQWIAENRLYGFGAIAGVRAAHLFALQILAPNIETDKRNFTRFLVLADRSVQNGNAGPPDKASISFSVPHQRGSLAKVLTLLANHECNLTKIQSLPILGREWEYYMHVDLEFDHPDTFARAIEAIDADVHELKILGQYQRGEKYS